jgi:opacity protein-like surface antigen
MSIRRTLLGAALLIAGASSANAADLFGGNGGSMKDGGAVAYAPEMSSHMPSIYLRGDFGTARYNEPYMFEPPNEHLSSTGIGSSSSFGGGVGYYFSKSVRTDFTLDWFSKADATGTVAHPGATFSGRRDFGIKSMVGLANVYYDFDTRTRFTPYLGVGVGFAHNNTTAGTVTELGTCGCYVPGSMTIDGAKSTSAAGALSAGFSAKLHDRLHLDAGYRLLYLGSAHTGLIRGTRTAAAPVLPGVPAPGLPATSPDPVVEDIVAHQFRVGIRWDIK